MKNRSKSIFLIIISILTTLIIDSCNECNSVIINIGNIPDSVLNLIPYKKDDTVKYSNTEGNEILFLVKTEINEVEIDNVNCKCCNTIKYNLNSTILHSEKTNFNIQFYIAYYDSYLFRNSLIIKDNEYILPTSGTMTNYDIFDTIYIDSVLYTNIYKITPYEGFSPYDEFYPDTIYYNFENGLIKFDNDSNESYFLDLE
jgi:hypothetical protein